MDRLELEQQMADLGTMLNAQQFDSLSDLTGFLNDFVGDDLDMDEPEPTLDTPAAQAQAIMQKAGQAADPAERIKLAQQALDVSPSCSDAYVLLAQESTTDPFKALWFYEKAETEGRKLLGEERLQHEAGRFWSMPDTRPYMRARRGLADTLWLLGRKAAAVGHYRAILVLNPADNQDVRYRLMTCLLDLEDPSLEELLEQYPEDAFSAWLYPKALWGFRQQGASSEATIYLQEAVGQNDNTPAYLLGQEPLPKILPDYHGWGDEAEAILYAAEARYLWQRTPGALAWLAETVA